MSHSTKNRHKPARTIGAGSRGSLLRGIAVLLATSCLVGPSRAEGPLDWVVSAITGQSPTIEQASISGDLSRGSVVQPSDRISTGDGERVVLTHGQDVLELQPNTTVAIGGAGPNRMATVVKLLDGTVHVKVGKRAPGRTFSVETRFLVATVKGTEFDVTADDDAAAVSVSEGTVAVQSAGGNRAVDVTPGRTAVAAAGDDDATPDLDATPAGGAPEAAKAAGKSAKDKAGKKSDGSAKSEGNGAGNGNGNGAGNGNGNGAGNGNGNGNGNGAGGGNGNGGGNANGNGGGNGNGHSRGRVPSLNGDR
jgi:hypothetical protein